MKIPQPPSFKPFFKEPLQLMINKAKKVCCIDKSEHPLEKR